MTAVCGPSTPSCRRARLGNGIARYIREDFASEGFAVGLEPVGWTAGEKKGPVNKEQPYESQPVAAGPAKVGAN